MKVLALKEEVILESSHLGDAQILIGIPSYNNAKTIGYVAEVAAQGLAKHFHGLSAVIVNADGNSVDGTREAFLKAHYPEGVRPISFVYQGLSGKGSAFRSIFELAILLKTKACIFLDSDLKSVSTDWIRLLGEPVLKGDYDYITPLYTRHKYDATITNTICYPLTRALYGRKIRQPIGGDFGCSTLLLEDYLEKDVWEGDVARFGIDIFMTIIALNEGHRLGQVAIGTKVHDQKDPSLHLGPMFKQVVGTFFSLMKVYEKNWFSVVKSQPVKVVGELGHTLPVEEVKVSISNLLASFQQSYERDRDLWLEVFSKEVYEDLVYIGAQREVSYQFPLEVWAQCVYDLAVSYQKMENRDRVIEILIPLYYGRLADFVKKTLYLTSHEAEDIVEEQCLAFEKTKPYLIERWEML